MFAASRSLQAMQGAGSMAFMALEGLLLVVAVTITVKAYGSATP